MLGRFLLNRCSGVLGAAIALATALASGSAAAYCNDQVCFCRSTTCSGDCPRDANGCKTSGKPLFWPTAAVGFSLQQDGTANLPFSSVNAVVKASFFAWTDLPCADGGTATMTFRHLQNVECHQAEYNAQAPNANIVMFQDLKWVYKGADNTLAKTTVSYDTDSGQIFDADIEVNSAFNDLTVVDGPPCGGDVQTDCVAYDLQSILTHEIGHFIGLDHSPVQDATMNASYNPGTTGLRTLAPDDIAGACAAYPPSRNVSYDATPKGGFASECQQSQADSGGCSIAGDADATVWTAPLLAAAFGMARRRRNSSGRRTRGRGAREDR